MQGVTKQTRKMDVRRDYKFWCKIVSFILLGATNLALFLISLSVNYQDELIKEHVRFRSGFPSQSNWIKPPQGILNCYLFNVTNTEEFLNGTDTKLKLVEVGPIVYRIQGKHTNIRINHTDSTMTYRKVRYEEVIFDAERSCSPDILNRTVITPNFVLLSAAARLHDWFMLVRSTFSAISSKEEIFLNRTVYQFLWNFTTPILERMSPYIPNVEKNAGMLHNAIKNKVEVFNVNIGMQHGLENFFKINSLNNQTIFKEQSSRIRKWRPGGGTEWCPVDVKNSFDNSVFPPYLTPKDELSFVAGDSCRVFQLAYDRNLSLFGFDGYRYVIRNNSDMPSCLDQSMGIALHKGMFDVTNCIFNVPAAFSYPHFFSSSYNWSEHFEGLSPNAENHETFLLIEPKTGIPFEEKYRFQSNIPMPSMDGFSKEIQRFSGMTVPSFWYEYDLDDLPTLVTALMRLTLYVAPKIQPICIGILLLASLMSFLYVHLQFHGATLIDFHRKIFCNNRYFFNKSSSQPTNPATELSTFAER